MESNKRPRIYLIIPRILLYTFLLLFVGAAILAIFIITIEDDHLREKILKIECIMLVIQGISAIIALFDSMVILPL